MSLPQLTVVPAAVETPGMRALHLMAEARQAADEQVHVLEEALGRVAELADQIADGGDVYPAGVRELCRRLSEDAMAKSQTVEAILQQHGVARRR
jgi:hypothetical protein